MTASGIGDRMARELKLSPTQEKVKSWINEGRR
jgi:hypothetical protein